MIPIGEMGSKYLIVFFRNNTKETNVNDREIYVDTSAICRNVAIIKIINKPYPLSFCTRNISRSFAETKTLKVTQYNGNLQIHEENTSILPENKT